MKLVAALALGCLMSAALPSVAEDQPPPEQNSVRKQISELKWIRGPQQVPLFGNSTLDLPAGYVFLNPAETAKLETITHNIGGGTEYFLAPEDLHWGAHFSFKDDGYVKDDEKIAAPSLLQSIKDGTAAANKIRRERGWDEMEVVGWQTSPHYETQTNRLEWAVTGKDLKSNVEVVNFNTRILRRRGDCREDRPVEGHRGGSRGRMEIHCSCICCAVQRSCQTLQKQDYLSPLSYEVELLILAVIF